jgi:manganese transport system ATP-binding protein
MNIVAALSGVSARYRPVDHWALRDIHLQINAGELVALLGPNGSGKSTLLRVIAGQLSAEQGEISVFGGSPGAFPHRLAHLPQNPRTNWDYPITVRHLVMNGRYLHTRWYKRASAKDAQVVNRALEAVDLAEQGEALIAELSGGQRRRALIARALAQEAEFLLLDEPAAALDHDRRSSLHDTIVRLRDMGKTLLVATHDESFPLASCDSVLTLRDGRRLESECTT